MARINQTADLPREVVSDQPADLSREMVTVPPPSVSTVHRLPTYYGGTFPYSDATYRSRQASVLL